MKVSILTTTLTLVASPVLAGLEICNDSTQSLSVAVGYAEGKAWVSEGWWNIGAGDCKTPLGGDLKNRYYYYRATAQGDPFISGDYMFCTTSDAFTIKGDENCRKRGYDEVGFSKVDTGKTAKNYTLTLVDAAGAKRTEEPPAPAPAPRSSTAAPGTYGEPYSNNATHQGCWSQSVAECAFHAEGTKFFVRDDGRTPSSVFAALNVLYPGTPISVEGDLEAIYDRTADVVLRNVSVRPSTEYDAILDKLQGSWYSTEDPHFQFNVLGSERENTYDGAPSGLEYISVSNWCGQFEGGGPYLYAMEEETGESYCYAVDYIDALVLNLTYLPRGNPLEFRKLD